MAARKPGGIARAVGFFLLGCAVVYFGVANVRRPDGLRAGSAMIAVGAYLVLAALRPRGFPRPKAWRFHHHALNVLSLLVVVAGFVLAFPLSLRGLDAASSAAWAMVAMFAVGAIVGGRWRGAILATLIHGTVFLFCLALMGAAFSSFARQSLLGLGGFVATSFALLFHVPLLTARGRANLWKKET